MATVSSNCFFVAAKNPLTPPTFTKEILTTHLDSDCKSLQDLVATHSNYMYTNDLFLGSSTDKLIHCRLFVLFLNLREIQRAEIGLICKKKKTKSQVKKNRGKRKRNDSQIVIFSSPNFFFACGSVKPTVPSGGCENTTVGMSS